MADATKRITDVDIIDSLNSDESFFVNQNSSIKQINKSNVVWGINNGGTGATTVSDARNALGLGNTDGALPVANGGTGATTAEEARINLGAVAMTTAYIELLVDNWVDKQQTIKVDGVTADNLVIAGANEKSYEIYNECGVRCVKQEENALTFSCNNVPNTYLVVNIAIFG